MACWKNPQGQHVYTGPDGRKGYSSAGCDAAKQAYFKVYGSSTFNKLKNQLAVNATGRGSAKVAPPIKGGADQKGLVIPNPKAKTPRNNSDTSGSPPSFIPPEVINALSLGGKIPWFAIPVAFVVLIVLIMLVKKR